MNKVQQMVLDKILKQLRQGTVPWQKPWISGVPRNYLSDKPYRGINLLLLGLQNYSSPYYLTWNQIKRLKGQVKKGEKAHMVVFYKPYVKEVSRYDEEYQEEFTVQEDRLALRYYHVFNIQQTNLTIPSTQDFQKIQPCEEFLDHISDKPRIIHEHSQSYYHVKDDYINLPNKNRFTSSAGYYTTLYHELIHSTGHPQRLNRKTITTKSSFGDSMYSQEELIAEIGAAMLCAHTGIGNHTINNSSSYIKGWLEVLKEKPRFIFTCASQAQKATDYLNKG